MISVIVYPVTVRWTGCSSTSHRCFIESRSGKLKGRGDAITFLNPFLYSMCSGAGHAILLQEAIWEYHCNEGVYLVCLGR